MIFMAGSLLYFGQTTSDWYKASTIHLTLCGLSPSLLTKLTGGVWRGAGEAVALLEPSELSSISHLITYQKSVFYIIFKKIHDVKCLIQTSAN